MYAGNLLTEEGTKPSGTNSNWKPSKGVSLEHHIGYTDWKTSTTKLISQLESDLLKIRRERHQIGMFRAMHFHEVTTDITDFIHSSHYSSLQQQTLPY